jgi:hypothetical protein
MEKSLGDTGRDNAFLNKKSILFFAQEIGPKINKWDYINLKIFCTAKETITRIKR